MYHLPKELIIIIYIFDRTYHEIYKKCILELKTKIYDEKVREYNEYVLWRSHCC